MKRLIIFGIIFLSLISVIFALEADNNLIIYTPLYNDTIDISGNSYNGTNSGVTFNGSNAYFDGSDYIDYPNLIGTIDYYNETVIFWVKGRANETDYEWLWVDKGNSDTYIRYSNSGNIISRIMNGGGISPADTRNDTWQCLGVVMDSTNQELYVNGISKGTAAIGTATIENFIMRLGQTGSGTYTFQGEMKDFAYFNISLNISQIQDFCANGIEFIVNSSINFVNITINNQNLINNSYFNTAILNFTTIVTNSSTNDNVNQTFFLYNGTGSLINTTQYATNNLTGNFVLNLSDGQYSIQFFAENNETNVTSELFFFIDDGVAPNITLLTNETEFVQSSINFSNIFNVTDSLSGLKSCTINITELENVTTPDNFLINCTDTQVFTSSGLHNAYVLAIDNADNNNTYSWNFTINPLIYIYFNNTENGSIVLDYNATIFHPDGRTTMPTVEPDGSIILSPVNNGSLDLGVHTIQFEKFGFITSNHTFNVTETSGNETFIFNVSPTNIIIYIYDRETGELLQPNTININILGLANLTTITGIATLQNYSISEGNYSVQAVSDDYYTEQKYFTYSGEANVSVSLYLLQQNISNAATLIVPVTDEWDNIISDAKVSLLEYDSSILGFKEVSQCYTDSNGECKFLIEVGTKTYIMQGQKIIGGILYSDQSSEDGEVFQPEISSGEILITEYIRALKLKLTTEITLPNFYGLIITAPANENETIVSQNDTSTVIYIPVSFSSSNGLDYTVCLKIYRTVRSSAPQELSNICTTGSSGILPTSNIVLNNDYDYKAIIDVSYNNQNLTYRTYFYENENSFFEMAKNEHYVNPLIMWLWCVILGLALSLRSVTVWVYGTWTACIIQTIMFPSIIFGSANVLIILINAGVLYLSKRQGDTR